MLSKWLLEIALQQVLREFMPDPEITFEIKIKSDVSCSNCPSTKNTAIIAVLVRFGNSRNLFKE